MAAGKSAWLKSSEEAVAPARGRKAGKQRPKTMAETADKHQLYVQAVQNPRREVRNLDVIFRTLSARYLGRRRNALVLREDFCGTAALCAEWVRGSSVRGRSAWGVDIDPEVIGYARKHTVGEDGEVSGGGPVHLVCGDVLDVGCDAVPSADLVVAFNFSVCYFSRRCDLVRYLRHSLGNLGESGLFFCDIFGGVEATQSQVSRVRNLGSFKYLFRQYGYDLSTNTVQLALSFKMKDGSMLKNCFTYKFRVYSLCEIREAMVEAGFGSVSIWISAKPGGSNADSDDSDEGNASDDSDNDSSGSGAFVELTSTMEMPRSFNAYVVGVKLPHPQKPASTSE
ncbi:hypothetical protein GGF46_000882 [Coemansia sp. RSA 552]|nr:hypothetical protein GGF46_000882 [Coemansia sp. RSA 552]